MKLYQREIAIFLYECSQGFQPIYHQVEDWQNEENEYTLNKKWERMKKDGTIYKMGFDSYYIKERYMRAN